MIKNSLFGLTLLLLTLALPSCGDDCVKGSGSIVTEVLDIDPFNAIRANGSFSINIKQGEDQFVEAVGHKNIIDRLNRTVQAGVWDPVSDNNCYKNFELELFITMPDIVSLESYGSGNISIESFDSLATMGVFTSGSGNITQSGSFDVASMMTIQSSGSGNVSLVVDCDTLDLASSGSGNISVNGTSVGLGVELLGSGDFMGFGLTSQFCSAAVSGSGNAEVSVSEVLNVTISGSGDVRYTGSPSSITSSITGSGELIDAN